MTRSQRELAQILTAKNKAAADAGRPYIRNPATLQQIAQATDPKAAARIVEGEATGNPAFIDTRQTGPDDNPFEVLIWAAYLGTQVCRPYAERHSEETQSTWAIFRQALAELIEQDSPFVKIAQNRAVNALSTLKREDLQIDPIGNAKAVIQGRNGRVSFEFRHTATAPADWNTTAAMMLAFLLENFANTKTASADISLREYADRRGITAKDLRDFQEETGRALDLVAAITSFEYREKIGGKWVPSGGMGFNGGTHFVKRGRIKWNWNADIVPLLENLAPMDFPREGYTVDPRTNQFQIIYYVSQNYRINAGRSRQDKIKISTLLTKLPNVPAIEKVRAQRQSARQKIVLPVLRDLDAIDCFTYDVVDENDNIVYEPDKMDYDSFIKSSILIDYTDWPDNAPRIESRDHREKKASKKGKSVQKTGGEVDAE